MSDNIKIYIAYLLAISLVILIILSLLEADKKCEAYANGNYQAKRDCLNI